MNQQTISIMTRVLEIIDLYKKNEVGLRYLVDSLEGSINALEEELPKEFYNDWFNSWVPLELFLALGKETINKEKIIIELERLHNLVTKLLSE
jgi:hypothetical protein